MKTKIFLTVFASLSIFLVANAQLRVTDQGRIGLRVLSPSYEIESYGTMRFKSSYGNLIFQNSGMYGAFTMQPESDWSCHLGLNNKRFGLIYGDHVISRVYTTSSDERIKENITTLEFENDNPVYQLRPVSYDFKKDHFSGVKGENRDELIDKLRMGHFGFLAQEVDQVLPELVDKTDAELYTMNYMEIIPFMVTAIQDQKELIVELQASNRELRAAIQNGSNMNNSMTKEELGVSLSKMSISPNPFSSSTEVNVQLESLNENTHVLITKLDGQTVKEYRVTSQNQSITISNETMKVRGIYLVSLTQNGKILQSEKLIYQ